MIISYYQCSSIINKYKIYLYGLTHQLWLVVYLVSINRYLRRQCEHPFASWPIRRIQTGSSQYSHLSIINRNTRIFFIPRHGLSSETAAAEHHEAENETNLYNRQNKKTGKENRHKTKKREPIKSLEKAFYLSHRFAGRQRTACKLNYNLAVVTFC